MEGAKPAVKSSTKVWIGSTVLTGLGLVFGAGMIVSGSLLGWRSDRVLGIYGRTGWSFHNLVSGDGKITFAAGVLFGLLMLAGLVLQSKHIFAAAVADTVFCLGFSIYEIVYIATRPGITGIANGLYLVLGGSVAGFMCALGAYIMMSESRGAPSSEPAEAASGSV